jgi:hypothetical protein
LIIITDASLLKSVWASYNMCSYTLRVARAKKSVDTVELVLAAGMIILDRSNLSVDIPTTTNSIWLMTP